MKEIKKKLTSGSYLDLGAFERDVHLMLSNAMTYNQEGSVST